MVEEPSADRRRKIIYTFPENLEARKRFGYYSIPIFFFGCIVLVLMSDPSMLAETGFMVIMLVITSCFVVLFLFINMLRRPMITITKDWMRIDRTELDPRRVRWMLTYRELDSGGPPVFLPHYVLRFIHHDERGTEMQKTCHLYMNEIDYKRLMEGLVSAMPWVEIVVQPRDRVFNF